MVGPESGIGTRLGQSGTADHDPGSAVRPVRLGHVSSGATKSAIAGVPAGRSALFAESATGRCWPADFPGDGGQSISGSRRILPRVSPSLDRSISPAGGLVPVLP